MTGLGVWRRDSQCKGVSKGVVVKLIRERALEGWKPVSLGCVCVLQVTLAYEKYSAMYVFR